MRRKLVSVLLTCAMSFSLAACGSSGSSTGNDTSDSSDTDSTEADASSDASDDSKDEKSSKAPSEVTADNLTDFPITDSSRFVWGYDDTYDDYYDKFDKETECSIYWFSPTVDNKVVDTKVVVVPSENKDNGKKVTQIGGGSQQFTFLEHGEIDDFDSIEAVVIPSSVEYIEDLWIPGITPKNLKYVVLPTKLENTGLEDIYDKDHQITWIYQDVEN